LDEIDFDVHIPFVRHLGFRLRLFEGGRSRLEFEPRPEHLNSFSVAHGGVLMTLLDVGMAHAARSAQPDMGVVTIEMKTSFMRPSQGLLACHGQVVHRTATLAFVEATIVNAQEQACAHATGTFKYVRRLATGARSANPLGVLSTD
jgi:uncharacterized protein (TIGR00369 family)